MSWGAFIQGGDEWEKINTAGLALNKAINCSVHYPAYNKRLFECSCDICFPVFMVDIAMQTGDWSMIIDKHKKEQ
jgi:hypothetical protein